MKNIRIICLFLLLIYSHITVGNSFLFQNIYPLILTILIISLILLFLLEAKKNIELIILSLIPLIYGLNIFDHILVIIIILYYILFLILELICKFAEQIINISFIIFIVTILTISLLVYFRVILERLPKDIPKDHNIYWICFGICVISFHVFRLYSLLKKPNTETSKNPIILKILQIVQPKISKILDFLQKGITWYFESLQTMYVALAHRYSFIGIILETCCEILTKYQTKYVHIWLLCIFDYFPRVIVAFFFFIDVCIYNRFYYFYNSIWLLIFPLLINVLFFSLKHFVNYNLGEIAKEIKITKLQVTDTNMPLLSVLMQFELIGEQEYPKEVYQYYYVIFQQTRVLLTHIEEFKQDFNSLVYFGISILYISSWSGVI